MLPPWRAALAALAAAALGTAGCGVPYYEHAALGRDLERAKAEAAFLARRCEDAQAASRTHVEACDTARTGAEAAARVLEQRLVEISRERGDLAGDLRQMEDRIQEIQARRKAADDRRRRRLTLLERFQAAAEGTPELKGVAPAIDGGLLVVTLPLQRLYDAGASELAADSAAVLDRLAEILRALPDDAFSVVAAAPDRALASGRALGVAAALAQRGVPEARLSAVADVAGGAGGAGGADPATLSLRLQEDLSAVPGFEAP